MIGCNLACVAEKAIINQNGLNVSLIDIIESIQTLGFPSSIPRMYAVFFLSRDLTDSPIPSLQLKAIIGDVEILQREIPVTFEDDKLRAHLFLEFQGFPIPQAGTLSFTLSEDSRGIATCSIDVTQIDSLPVTTPRVLTEKIGTTD